jgi:hypothetical protein
MISPGPWYVPKSHSFGIRTATGEWLPLTPDNVRMMAAAPALRTAAERLLSGADGAREDAIALLESLPE